MSMRCLIFLTVLAMSSGCADQRWNHIDGSIEWSDVYLTLRGLRLTYDDVTAVVCNTHDHDARAALQSQIVEDNPRYAPIQCTGRKTPIESLASLEYRYCITSDPEWRGKYLSEIRGRRSDAPGYIPKCSQAGGY